MKSTDVRWGRVVSLCAAMVMLSLLVAVPAQAVRLDSVYSAEVPMPARGNLNVAFDAALSKVLVKVTGLASLGEPAARRSLVSSSAGLVSKYTQLPERKLRVEFDAEALQRILDGAGQPVWGADRPLIAMWYAVDAGGGARTIVAGANDAGERSNLAVDELREALLQSADDRGLPVVMPLLDAEDMSNVTFADLWGDFGDRVMAASNRYGADAVMIGRARSLSPNDRRVRWSLVTGNERFAWQGSLSDGPGQAANYLSQRLATYAGSAGALRLMITNVDTLAKFGEVRKYILSLDVVQNASIARVADDRIEFDLVVRGDASRLSRSLDSGRLVARAERGIPTGAPTNTRLPDLVYTWAGR